MEIMFQKVLTTLVNVQFSQKSLHFWDMDFMFVVWKCTDIYSGKSENHFCHNNPVTVLCTPHCTSMALTYEINLLPEAYSSSIWTILGCKGVFGKLHGMTFLAF